MAPLLLPHSSLGPGWKRFSNPSDRRHQLPGLVYQFEALRFTDSTDPGAGMETLAFVIF